MTKKKILVIVDMQNDFVSGELKTKNADVALKNILKKIDKVKFDYIFATLDTHYENYLETREGKNLPVLHCIKYSAGWSLPDELSKALMKQNTKFVEKSTFGSVDLANQIKDIVKDDTSISIELVGVCTDICVVSNALFLKSWLPENPIFVDAKCCDACTASAHTKALDVLKSCQIEILNYNKQ